MKFKSAKLYGYILFLILFCFFYSANAQEDPILKIGRKYTQWYFEGNPNEFYNHFSDQMKKFISLENFKKEQKKISEVYGKERVLISELVIPRLQNQKMYIRKFYTNQHTKPFKIIFVVDKNEIIYGFQFSEVIPEAKTTFLNYQTKTDLQLPFSGLWHVLWGGRTVDENYHASVSNQRFAYDFFVTEKDFSYKNKGTKNTDYFCFDKPILAPGKGIIIASENTIADNKPGVMNAKQILGNHVVIDHGNGEFSFLAHFKKGSVLVKSGDKVFRGQEIGLCGNSGNSSEPHLHYHLQTNAVFQKGEGLPAQFQDYLADGKRIKRGEPRKGQLILRRN